MRVEYNKKPNPKPITSGTKKTIHVINILDSSGSMGRGRGSKWEAAVQGVQQEIESLKQDDSVDYLYTLVVFGESSKKIFDRVNIKNVNYTDSWRSEWATALYQTVGETLENYNTDDPVLVKIFTDGQNNQYRGKYSSTLTLKKLLKDKEEANFTITFVGTEYDVKDIQRTLDIAEGNTLVHDNTFEGVSRSFKMSNEATTMYSKAISEGKITKTKSFYSKSIIN